MANLPPKTDFLQTLESLSYHERIKKAHEFGRDNAASAQLSEWIAEMRKHPDPVAPAMPAEEGFTELLPPQKLNIAKYYVEDQVALAVVVGSKTQTEVLVNELNSPSKWFIKRAARQVPRQVKDDAVIEKQVLSGSRVVRKNLLHALVKQQNVALLEKLYPVLHQQKGPEVAIDILHGCSSAFVKDKLQAEPDLWSSPHLSAKMMAQRHGLIMMELLEEELQTKHFSDRGEVWTKWSPRFKDAFFYKAHHTAQFWKLWMTYPWWTYKYSHGDGLKFDAWDASNFHISYPNVIESRIRHFLVTDKTSVFEFWKGTSAKKEESGHHYQSVPSSLYSSKWSPKYTDEIIDMFRSFYNIDGYAPAFRRRYYFFSQANQVIQNASPQQVLKLLKAVFEFYRDDLVTYFVSVIDSVRKAFERLRDLHNANSEKLKSSLLMKEDPARPIVQLQANRTKLHAAHGELLRYVLQEIKATFVASDYATDEIEKIWNAIAGYSDTGFPPSSVAILLEEMKPWTDKSAEAIEHRNDSWVYRWDEVFSRIGQFLISSCAEYYHDPRVPVGRDSEATIQLAKDAQAEVIKVFYGFWKTDPIEKLEPITATLLNVDRSQADALYDCFELSHIQHLLSLNPAKVTSGLWGKLTYTRYQEHLAGVLASPNTPDKLKDDLQAFLDPSDHGVRKTLEKAMDSNSEPQRKAAAKWLIDATFRTRSAVQLKRTLNFLRTKLKNEQITMRTHGIAQLMTDEKQHIISDRTRTDEKVSLNFPSETTPEILEQYLNILQDALEVRDLDLTCKDDEGEGGGKPLPDYQKVTANHPLLRHFLTLSHAALLVGAKNPTGDLFNFGIEVQWRIDSFRKGPKDVVKSFHVSLPPTILSYHTSRGTDFFSREDKEGFVKGIIDGVEARVGAKNKNWRDTYPWESLFLIVNHDWVSCPSILNLLASSIAQIPTKKDTHGVYLLESTAPVLKMFEFILNMEKANAYGNKLVQEYFETVLKSHQARSVVFQWLKSKEYKLRRKAQKQQRDQSVQHLLEVSPSAIHLNFVWRHLVNWNQNKLDPFINAQNPFRGPFYEPPAERKFRTPKPEVKPEPTSRRRARRAVVAPVKFFSFNGEVKHARKDVKGYIKKQKKAEKKMLKDLAKKPSDDHEDYFVLPGCFALDRLLPRQIENLAKQWASIAKNGDRAIPYRTIACRRWTLMPTINYADIVQFVGENSGFAVNLLEALLQGTILNDEPLAPLNYLLSPEFLSSDRARVAAYAVSASVKYLKSVGITDIITLVLSGKRREGLKVTVYKEMIRLLASMPTSKHISMIETEWKRKELHRDVRITIIKAAFLFLAKNTEKGTRVAWEIFKDAISAQKQEDWKASAEILTALLGAAPQEAHDSADLTEALFLKPLLLEFHEQTSKCKVPKQHCQQFAEEIVLPLCTTALNNDVQIIALFSLLMYKTQGSISISACDLLYHLMADEKNNLINSEKPNDQAVFDARWRHAGLHLLKFTATNAAWSSSQPTEKIASKDYVTRILTHTVDRILAYAIEERRKRIHMVQNLENFIERIPATGPHSLWDWNQEQAFLKPLHKMGNFFWLYLIKRRVEQFNAKWHYLAPTATEDCLALLHEMFEFASTRPDVGTKVVEFAKSMLKDRVPHYNSEAEATWEKIVIGLLNFSVYKGEGERSKAYTDLVLRSTLEALKWGSSSLCNSNTHDIIQFFDTCVKAASAGDIPDLTKSLPQSFYEILKAQTNKLNYRNRGEPRKFCATSITLFNHLLKTYLVTPVDGNITPLVITIEFVNQVLKQDALMLALGLHQVGKALHWVLQEQTGVTNASTLASQILSLIEQVDSNSPTNCNNGSYTKGSKPNSSVLTIIAHLLDQDLDSLGSLPNNEVYQENPEEPERDLPPRPVRTAYNRLSIEISLAVLKKYPLFLTLYPKCFHRFLALVIQEDKKETVSSPLRFQTISDIVCSAYYSKLCYSTYQQSESIYAEGLAYAQQLLEESKKSDHPIFYRSVACHLSLFLGFASNKRNDNDTTYTWRPQFTKMLDVFCHDEEGSIKKLAWKIDTTTPVTASPYSRLTSIGKPPTPSGW